MHVYMRLWTWFRTYSIDGPESAYMCVCVLVVRKARKPPIAFCTMLQIQINKFSALRVVKYTLRLGAQSHQTWSATHVLFCVLLLLYRCALSLQRYPHPYICAPVHNFNASCIDTITHATTKVLFSSAVRTVERVHFDLTVKTSKCNRKSYNFHA